MQILSVVWQEYKYDWSEHMARDERFHPAIMVCKLTLYSSLDFELSLYEEYQRIKFDIFPLIFFRELFS